MRCASYRIVVKQGANFYRGLTITDLNGNPVDITGFTFKGEIRTQPGGLLIGSFVFTPISAINGRISMTLSNIVTAAMIPGDYFYDVKMTQVDSTIFRILSDECIVSAEVTV